MRMLAACCVVLVVLHLALHARRLSYAGRWLAGMPALAFFALFGLLWGRLHDPALAQDDLRCLVGDHAAWEVRVDEVATDNGRMVRAWSTVHAAVDTSGRAHAASGRLQLTLLKPEGAAGPFIGDRLLVAGIPRPLDRIPDPGGFDARGWAAAHATSFTCFAPAGHWRVITPAAGLARWFEAGRRQVSAWLMGSGLGDRERASVKAVLLGLRDELTTGQKEAYIRSGTMHVLAVSGGHVAFIYGGLLLLLGRLGAGRSARLLRGCIVLLVLWAYAGLTGASPSVLRATLTCSLFTIAEMVRGRVEPINSLGAAAFVLLMIDPAVMAQLGFQLSFLAVLGIVLCYRPLLALWAAPNAVLHYAWTLLVMSISAQVFTLPVSLLMFQSFPVWFIPANLLVVGMVFVAVYIGFFLVLLHAVPVLGTLLAWVAGWWLRVLDGTAAFFAWLPGAYPAVRIDAMQCLALYGLVIAGLLWWLRGWRPARVLTLACALCVLLGWGWNARERDGQGSFVVYDDRDTLSLAVVQGRSMLVFADTSDPTTRLKVERHARAQGLRHWEQVDAVPKHLNSGGTTVLLDPEDRSWALSQGPMVVVLDGARTMPDSALMHDRRLSAVVLGPRYPRWRKQRIADLLKERPVRLHDIRAHGAYVR